MLGIAGASPLHLLQCTSKAAAPQAAAVGSLLEDEARGQASLVFPGSIRYHAGTCQTTSSLWISGRAFQPHNSHPQCPYRYIKGAESWMKVLQSFASLGERNRASRFGTTEAKPSPPMSH